MFIFLNAFFSSNIHIFCIIQPFFVRRRRLRLCRHYPVSESYGIGQAICEWKCWPGGGSSNSWFWYSRCTIICLSENYRFSLIWVYMVFAREVWWSREHMVDLSGMALKKGKLYFSLYYSISLFLSIFSHYQVWPCELITSRRPPPLNCNTE